MQNWLSRRQQFVEHLYEIPFQLPVTETARKKGEDEITLNRVKTLQTRA